MKKIIRVIVILIFASFYSCENNDSIINEDQNSNLETQQRGAPVSNFDWIWETETDFISADHGCYTVNVRVYLVQSNGQRVLSANENVQIGDCNNNQNRSAPNTNGQSGKCNPGYLDNGDYIFGNKTSNNDCLIDLLQKEEVFNQYIESTNELLKLNR